MTQKQKEVSASIFASVGVFVYASVLTTLHEPGSASTFSWEASIIRPEAYAFMTPNEALPDTMLVRTAKRLRKRLTARKLPVASVTALADGIVRQRDLLNSTATVTFATAENPEYGTWEISLQAYPQWIDPGFSYTGTNYHISKQRIAEWISLHPPLEIDPPEHTTIEGVQHPPEDDETGKPIRALTPGVAKAGHELDVTEAAEIIETALSTETSDVTVTLHARTGTVTNNTHIDLGALTLLASGKSNFRGSTHNRKHNVRKGLSEHVNNVIVPPGETFSFNDTLEGPVSLSNGWAKAKIIINGDELVPAPGGGICQASTTTYRAILMAGFPVEKRRSHSLYVSYYEKYGVGIDATIFPGSQDLSFVNDTGNYLLIQAYTTEEDDAYVNIYGTPDGRSVVLEGPYFAGTEPLDFSYKQRNYLGRNEIAWIQRVTYANGQTDSSTIVSRYKTIPQYITRKYTQDFEPVQMHAGAPQIQ